MTPETMIPLNLYLNYMSRAYEDFIKRKLNNPYIDPAELPFLIGIYHNEGASQNEISASFRVTEAYVTKMLNKLEKKDLIKREYDPNNKTRKLIYLTNKGREKSLEAIEVIKEWELYLTDDLTDEEKEQFKNIFLKITKKATYL